jgi:glutathione peroxidase
MKSERFSGSVEATNRSAVGRVARFGNESGRKRSRSPPPNDLQMTCFGWRCERKRARLEGKALVAPGEREREMVRRRIGLIAVLGAVVGSSTGNAIVNAQEKAVQSLFEIKTTTLAGQPADLGQYAGKVILVVNVASKCGLTPQYQGLEALHRELGPRGLVILGFPSNDFAGQEPGTPDEIQEFCKKNYGVTFPLFSKVVTKAGEGQSPVYQFLTKSGAAPPWNFAKYLLGKDGKVVAFFPSQVPPEAPALRGAVEKALEAPGSR